MGNTDHGSTIDLETSIQRLRASRRQLKDIDDDELDALPVAKRREWARALQRLSVAITKLETADLQNLSAEFIAGESRLRAAATKLDEDLAHLADTIAMIDAASTAVKTVTEVVSLLA